MRVVIPAPVPGLVGAMREHAIIEYGRRQRMGDDERRSIQSLASFDTLVAAQKGWVLVPGHHPSRPWMLGDAVS